LKGRGIGAATNTATQAHLAAIQQAEADAEPNTGPGFAANFLPDEGRAGARPVKGNRPKPVSPNHVGGHRHPCLYRATILAIRPLFQSFFRPQFTEPKYPSLRGNERTDTNNLRAKARALSVPDLGTTRRRRLRFLGERSQVEKRTIRRPCQAAGQQIADER